MYISFGQYRNRSIEHLMFTNPSYVLWMLTCPNPAGPLVRAQDHVEKLVVQFDDMPIVKKCHEVYCPNTASFGCIYQGTLHLHFYCDKCGMFPSGEVSARVQGLSRFWEVQRYVRDYCKGSTLEFAYLMRLLGEAKGLPKDAGEYAAEQFFRKPAVPTSAEKVLASS